LPDSQAGHFRSFKLRSFLASHDEESNPTNEGQAAEHGRNGNPIVIFPGNVHWAYIHYTFVMGVSESLISQGQPAQND